MCIKAKTWNTCHCHIAIVNARANMNELNIKKVGGVALKWISRLLGPWIVWFFDSLFVYVRISGFWVFGKFRILDVGIFAFTFGIFGFYMIWFCGHPHEKKTFTCQRFPLFHYITKSLFSCFPCITWRLNLNWRAVESAIALGRVAETNIRPWKRRRNQQSSLGAWRPAWPKPTVGKPTVAMLSSYVS